VIRPLGGEGTANMAATIVSPKMLLIGGGAVREIAGVLAKLGRRSPLIVTDPFMQSSGMLARVTAPLDEAKIKWQAFAETVSDPTDTAIEAGVAKLRAGSFDVLVAIGGGSPIDTAKGMAILASGGGKMRDYKVPFAADRAELPVVAIPTTAGTGSEVTRFTVVNDTQNDEKMLIAGLGCLPAAALVDYELTMALPKPMTGSTGMDALTHALEAYVSKKANPYSDQMALAAVGLLARNIRTAYGKPGDRAAREAMMLGATFAGLAFSNASVALVHGMARPIGAFFHVHHGTSIAMLLPAVTAYSAEGAPGRYASAARAMGLAGGNDAEAVRALVAELRRLNQDLGIPTPKAHGIDEKRWTELLPTMAAQAIASGSPANNPRVPNPGEIVEIYKQAWA
jgi:alcohol dehydrogenase class IV